MFFLLFLIPLGLEPESVTTQDVETIAQTPQTECPVTGDPIQKEFYVDVRGKRIYVCSEASRQEVEKNPEVFLLRLESQGIVLENVSQPQTACPVDGHPIDSNLYVEVDGKRIYVCSETCRQRAEVLRVKYLRQMENLGIEVQHTARK